jgi:nucleotide-binding universal stress UspA family protein
VRFTRILCAVDFQPASGEGLKLATTLARVGAALEICTVVERERMVAELGDWPAAAQLIAELAASAETQLEARRRETATLVPDVQAVSLGGASAWNAIVKEAERFGADLVVMGAGARAHLLGSVAERVARHAPCSVLVVAGPAPPLARVLGAVDFSPPSRLAMLAAGDVAAERGATLALVHVVSAPGPELAAMARAGAEDRLRAWAAEVAPRAGTKVEWSVGDGPVADGILERARAGGHDLVVLGTHGRTGIARALLGSVAERVIRRAERAVLVVR